jgi:hypothetical protein
MRNRQAWLMVIGALVVALLGMVFASGPYTANAQGQTGSNWQAYYWNNKDFSGAPVLARVDPAINFNWGTGSPDASVPADNFSARWYNTITLPAGTYRFRAGADDGIRVAINGQIIINLWTDAVNGFQVTTADVVLGAGTYNFIVDYYEAVGEAGVLFDWTVAGAGGFPEGVATAVTTPLPTWTPLPTVKAVVIVDVANVRAGPGRNYPTIAQVARDEVYMPVARNGDFGFETWYLIPLPGGGQGWIFRQLVYLYNGDPALLPVSQVVVNAPAITPVGEASTGAPAGVGPFEVKAVTRNAAIVRDIPSLYSSSKIGVIDIGQTVNVLRLSLNHAWVLVDFNGLQGWVYVPSIRVVVGNLGNLPRGN